MANIIGELLFAILRGFIADGAYALFIKLGAWLDTKISGRKAKVIMGMFLGLAAYFLIPVVVGLLGL